MCVWIRKRKNVRGVSGWARVVVAAATHTQHMVRRTSGSLTISASMVRGDDSRLLPLLPVPPVVAAVPPPPACCCCLVLRRLIAGAVVVVVVVVVAPGALG
jgi:hypothetical protein